MRTLGRPGLEQARAGIALQAYIPDSFATQQRINEWARKRMEKGGAPITIRLVKGANMEAERVEASLKGWPQAPYKTKLETDANYLRMLHEGMLPENLAAVRLGIASHNLFTLSYGLVLATKANALDRVQFEMLEGMANHQRRAVFELTGNMLLYAPACTQEDFTNAIGYLVRRMDENTGPDNYLRYAFNIEVDSPEWLALERQFLAAFEAIGSVSGEPRRGQERGSRSEGGEFRISDFGFRNRDLNAQCAFRDPKSAVERAVNFGDVSFSNEPDTDWSLLQNGVWAQGIVDTWRHRCGTRAVDVPLVIGGDEILDSRPVKESIDPSRPGVIVARYRQASEADIERAVITARMNTVGWRGMPIEERTALLYRVADEIAAARGELMGAMIADGGKTIAESDPEVSEAIDFCRFYAESVRYFQRVVGAGSGDQFATGAGSGDPRTTDAGPFWAGRVAGMVGTDVSLKMLLRGAAGQSDRAIYPLGVVVVVSPWNFPLAIPCGGVAAALAAGNNVILKPASDTVLIAYLLCQCFWRAGVPRTALQFAPCSGGTVGQQLVSHDGVDAVILTGGTSTAAQMLRKKPTMNLLAETGGKNATIVTALSDRDQAIKNVLHSAFSHSGQKCSATSLLILESEVYHDARFRATLCDAVESLRVGSVWDLPTKIGPLIRPPSGALETGLKELEPGEEWAVMPRLHVDGNPHLVGPGVKWGVQANSFTHCTELFGPVLGVMEARDLDHAIELVNATGYGLTSGLESLDDREQELWTAKVRVGNLYINRSTTGAIVLRQPFGGMGKSSVGPGIKAGGLNYVAPLMRLEHRPAARVELEDAKVHVDVERALQISRIGESRDHQPTHHLGALRQAMLQEGGELEALVGAIDNYAMWGEHEFRALHDHFRLLGEDNFRRYLPVEPLRIRVHADDSLSEIFLRAAAARAAGCRATVSSPWSLTGPAAATVELLDRLTDSWAGAIEFIEEDDESLAEAIRSGQIARVRYATAARVPDIIRAAAAESLQYVADTPVSTCGRVELLWYVREQSISHVYHRYGNLGSRAEEVRNEPA